MGALIQSWWLNGQASTQLIDKTASIIEYTQVRNALARKFHTKKTRQKLRRIGIKLTKIKRCKWP